MTKGKTAVGGVGGSQDATAAIVNLRVGDISRTMPVMVINQSKTPALLGETFYNGYHYDIDSSAGMIRLVKKTSKRRFSQTTYNTINIPFEQVGNNMVVQAKINGTVVPMFFDTGAAGVVFSLYGAAAAGIHVPYGARQIMSGGVGGAAPGFQFEVERVELGGISQTHVPVTVLVTGGPPLPLLGQPFFQNRRFTIDNENHLIKFAQ
jgi:clan AA aspartic protease (TIGR02281 family)